MESGRGIWKGEGRKGRESRGSGRVKSEKGGEEMGREEKEKGADGTKGRIETGEGERG